MVGFLFDNDGVLIDSSEWHWLSWQLLMKEKGREFLDYATFVKGFGKRNDLILEEVLPELSREERAELAKRKEELFRQEARGKIRLLPGMESFLTKVAEAGIPRVIASSTPLANLEMFIQDTVLGHFFTNYVSAESCVHGKPYPDIFLKAAEVIGKRAEQCIVFEDALSGIEAARRAGAFVVALATTHKKSDLKDYDLLYDDPTSLNLEEILMVFSQKK